MREADVPAVVGDRAGSHPAPAGRCWCAGGQRYWLPPVAPGAGGHTVHAEQSGSGCLQTLTPENEDQSIPFLNRLSAKPCLFPTSLVTVCVCVCVCVCVGMCVYVHVCMIVISVTVKRSGLTLCVEDGHYTNTLLIHK